MQRWLVIAFPLLALVASGVAYAAPGLFVGGRGAIVPLLMAIMFAMGLPLTVDDLKRVATRPTAVVAGTIAQFVVMPLAAWLLAKALGLPPALTVGLVLVGVCPGGTASNVVCYLARADVALSVTLTAVSTLLAVVATPWLAWLYLGETVPVSPAEMLASVATIVLGPVVAGLVVGWLVRRVRPNAIDRGGPALALIAVLAVVAIIAIVVALNANRIAELSGIVLLAVVLHNAIGLASGYGVGWLLRRDEATRRTLAIEVGMQNSGLAVALASTHFASLAAATLPGAMFSIWHNLSGAGLAAWWGSRRQKPATSVSTA